MNESKVICPWPWLGWSSQTDGGIRVCPYAQASSSRGVCRADDAQPLRADECSIDASRNNPVLKGLRRRMLAGESAPEICGRCYAEEEAGLQSRRKIEVARGLLSLEEMRRATQPDGHLATELVPLKIFDIRLGNRCNLSCRMCSPGSSNKYYREWFHTRLKPTFSVGDVEYQLRAEANGVVTVGSDNFQWYEKSNLWEHLLAHAEGVTELHFSGGEPLLIEEHIELLRKLSELPAAKNISISYNTNLTLLPEKIVKYWREFKDVQVAISLDAVGEANNYIRYPSKFEEIERNLSTLENASPNVSFWINSTVQLMNSFAIFDLWKWIFSRESVRLNHWFGFKSPHNLFISHTRLNHPAAFSLEAMPQHLRPKWIAEADAHLAWLEECITKRFGMDTEMRKVHNQSVQVVNGYKNILLNSDKSELLPEFFRKIELGDEFRKQSFAAAFPELHAELLAGLERKLTADTLVP